MPRAFHLPPWPNHVVAFATATTIADAVEFANSYTTEEVAVKSVSRGKVVLYEGGESTANARGLYMLLATCSGEITRGDKENRPELHIIATKLHGAERRIG